VPLVSLKMFSNETSPMHPTSPLTPMNSEESYPCKSNHESEESINNALDEDFVDSMEFIDLNGNCLFFDAVNTQDYYSIDLFLENGGDINLVNPLNLKTALFIAVDNNDDDMIEYLIGRGANTQHQDAGGMTFEDYRNFFG